MQNVEIINLKFNPSNDKFDSFGLPVLTFMNIECTYLK